MITKDEYEKIYRIFESFGSCVTIKINDMIFTFDSCIYKSKLYIYCFVMAQDGNYKSVDSDIEEQKIICDTKIIKSYFNRHKSKLTKRELKLLNETLSEESKKNYEYKIPFWNNSRKFVNHLKKLEKQGYEIEWINKPEA